MRSIKRFSRPVALGLVATLAVIEVPAVAAAGPLRVTYEGVVASVRTIPGAHCHDDNYPEIRCFATAAARDADIAVLQAQWAVEAAAGLLTPLLTNYATWYQDQNYGGYTYTTAVAWSNLGDIGWNDMITSFKSLNGGQPKWYVDINYGGAATYWSAGAWVSNVGSGWNDSFSSVYNLGG